MPGIYFEIIGWLGTILIMAAYFLVTAKKISPSSDLYQILNLFGAVFVIVNVIFHGALPSVALNSIWALIAIYGLIKNHKKEF